MPTNVMETWLASSHLSGANSTYIEDLYESYLDDPCSVDANWREVFDELPSVSDTPEERHSVIREQMKHAAKAPKCFTPPQGAVHNDAKQVKVLQLIGAYRHRGHEAANLDPLGLVKNETIKELDPFYHDLTGSDLDANFNVGSFAAGNETMILKDLVASLKRTYCGSLGVEYMHITDTEEKRWIQNRIESSESRPSFSNEAKQRFLEELTAAEGLERYIGSKFPGAKRFSLEGGDSFVPMLKELIRRSGEQGAEAVVIGMAHRGRLNVLVNVLGKKPTDLFNEFAGKHDNIDGSSDVKYHQGFSSDFKTPKGNVHLSLAFNPSHLEIVNPVVLGSVRARQERLNGIGESVLPITIHGDSAIAGQGVVQETFNMSQARAFKVSGTIRIVINNQVGFTTSNREDTRSTRYCTDIAKMVQAPIFHVNGDDPEAVMHATQIAIDFRNKFKRDVVIDLVCYRRHGHNEADEPSATQPVMYKKIKKHPTTREIYSKQLESEGVISSADAKSLISTYRDALDNGECVVKEWQEMQGNSIDWTPYLKHTWQSPYEASFQKERLRELAESISQYPEDQVQHSRVAKIYKDRLMMARGEKLCDWGFAENLAYATLLDSRYNIRLVGQDSGRGTFFHRHAVLHEQSEAGRYIPLQNISDEQGHFDVHDSVLSEEAVLAFEYGYSTAAPKGLCIWEAQFGDFANGAQVVFDQFLSSGEQKWGRMCGLTVLLPHGYEGQGPEHSSARLERYLQLCAEHNMQVCIPSTPAQVYHMLRRQVIRSMRRPLIVMSPKSLLRHPMAVSSLDELSSGTFQNAIGEVDELDPKSVNRVVLCSGKVYYELLDKRRTEELNNVAIVRIEQLYPFPMDELNDIIEQYAHVKDFVWCQEEPQNQGAWYCSQHNFRTVLPEGANLQYAGRAASASTAVGYMSLHVKQQKALVNEALGFDEQ
ncbi:2-oxoglutarate dehydrogenase E1 component [Psychromonas sp. 14N.309.X.WAT.B.A12]|uniref:2-oxoglutarate dehydrogenase E1 component n=1 Tax=unclassified Psychromonas TaxID=2614957 RepID=UPI0025AF7609|nr:2-oxoglutarate dehydrogenase E1 component [Psychromonas sp. 14N.309.X.WAT.B.A12]MDN2663246.1 2-oxoglutarate dehydrogenase E1 component [Psychromonas sp. 14N.309.X.WAT.B.A12]